ncbi:MAG: hypothetical protein EXS16_21520 [Gemmataceae bacterium]|nr:hypothetical protein [Gemmataceae bacterium]
MIRILAMMFLVTVSIPTVQTGEAGGEANLYLHSSIIHRGTETQRGCEEPGVGHYGFLLTHLSIQREQSRILPMLFSVSLW